MSAVLLTGATGFVGSALCPALRAAGFSVRAASRDATKASAAHPGLDWVTLDVNRPETIEPALRGVQSAVYLVHGMSAGPGYEQREVAAARAFAAIAGRVGLDRIVYLGGVAPAGVPSRHLSSRLATGEALRAGSVPVFELRASMIIGRGSISWQIVRDLAARLPAMLLPRWLSTRTQPIGIDDVAFAVTAALALPIDAAGVYDIPGPETLTAKEILFRVAALRGTRPIAFAVPILSPHLSSYWLKFVTGADYVVARELVDGLSSDILASAPLLWDRFPDHELVGFDQAARRAMSGEDEAPLQAGRLVELAVRRISRRSRRTDAH